LKLTALANVGRSSQGFVAGTGRREAAAKEMIARVQKDQQDQWEAWKDRISELRNAILEHPNVDSSALGVFDRDALEVTRRGVRDEF